MTISLSITFLYLILFAAAASWCSLRLNGSLNLFSTVSDGVVTSCMVSSFLSLQTKWAVSEVIILRSRRFPLVSGCSRPSIFTIPAIIFVEVGWGRQLLSGNFLINTFLDSTSLAVSKPVSNVGVSQRAVIVSRITTVPPRESSPALIFLSAPSLLLRVLSPGRTPPGYVPCVLAAKPYRTRPLLTGS